jgi:hypothetical protein
MACTMLFSTTSGPTIWRSSPPLAVGLDRHWATIYQMYQRYLWTQLRLPTRRSSSLYHGRMNDYAAQVVRRADANLQAVADQFKRGSEFEEGRVGTR